MVTVVTEPPAAVCVAVYLKKPLTEDSGKMTDWCRKQRLSSWVASVQAAVEK